MIVVKKFSASWCGPCRMLAPMLNEVKESFPSVVFEDIDIDENVAETQKHSIKSVPTVVIMKAGKEVNRLTGLQSKLTYRNVIMESL